MQLFTLHIRNVQEERACQLLHETSTRDTGTAWLAAVAVDVVVDVMDVEVAVTDDEVTVNVVVAVVNADIRIAQRSLRFVLLSLLPPKTKKPRKSLDQTAEAPMRGCGSVALGNSWYQALTYRDTASPASWATSSSPNGMTPALLTSNPAETREKHFLFHTSRIQKPSWQKANRTSHDPCGRASPQGSRTRCR